MPNAGTQTDKEEAIPCPAIVGGGDGGDGVEFACVVCRNKCSKPHELDDGWETGGQMEPVVIQVCGLYCRAQLDGNHRCTRGLPGPDQVMHTRIAEEYDSKWTVGACDGIIFTEGGIEYIFLTAYREDSECEYIPRVCITLAVLMEILAKQ